LENTSISDELSITVSDFPPSLEKKKKTNNVSPTLGEKKKLRHRYRHPGPNTSGFSIKAKCVGLTH